MLLGIKMTIQILRSSKIRTNRGVPWWNNFHPKLLKKMKMMWQMMRKNISIRHLTEAEIVFSLILIDANT